MALKPENPVVGGTVLRRQAIQSPDYVPGVSGWTINQDGSAEFNNLTIRGIFMGTNFEINTSGAFFYAGTPAAGNLIASTTTAAGVDAFGNNYLANISSYGPGSATSLNAGFITFYTGSLAAGWTPGATLTLGAGVLFLTAAAGINLADAATAGSTLDVMGALTAGAGLGVIGGTVTDTLQVTGNVNMDTSTIDVANGNVNLNMAAPPNAAAVLAGTATQAQYNACLRGMLQSMVNRQLFA